MAVDDAYETAAGNNLSVDAPGNLLGQTAGRNWTDVPPPGAAYFYRVITPSG